MPEVSKMELYWDNEIWAILRTEGFTSWVLGAEFAKPNCRKAFYPASILSRQSCGGNCSFVCLLLPPHPQSPDFCLNAKNHGCNWILVTPAGQQRSREHRGTTFP